MKVSVSVCDRRFAVDSRTMARVAQSILRRESAQKWAIDIIYCRDRDILPLNREFKGHRRSTDVLSFDLRDKDSYLGEIYVNLQMARRQARENRVPYNEEVKRLTIHGILHLLGYRDDTLNNRAAMWARQESYLN